MIQENNLLKKDGRVSFSKVDKILVLEACLDIFQELRDAGYMLRQSDIKEAFEFEFKLQTWTIFTRFFMEN